MIDYRQFLAEGYDADDKNDVLHDFMSFLESRYNTTYDPKQKRYVNDRLWFALGNGGGSYRDPRITVGIKRSALEDGESRRTLCFLVTDTGELLAYLDAEDSGLLDNTPVRLNDGKAFAQWNLGATDEQESSAFVGASDVIDKFFADVSLYKSNVSMVRGGYDKRDKRRLLMAMQSRREQEYVNWTRDDEIYLQNLYKERKNLTKALSILKDEAAAAIADKDKHYEIEVGRKMQQLQQRQAKVKEEIEDLETDKLKYTKQLKSHVSDASKRETRADNIKLLGLDYEDAVEYSDEELADMVKDIVKDKYTKTGKLRKQRAIKTGDVMDAIRNDELAKNKSIKKNIDGLLDNILKKDDNKKPASSNNSEIDDILSKLI